MNTVFLIILVIFAISFYDMYITPVQHKLNSFYDFKGR